MVDNAVKPGAWARVSLRATPVRVGEATLTVRFVSKSEDRPFTLDVDRVHAPLIGRLLFSEVDIEALIARDDQGSIESGTLVRLEPVAMRGAAAAWRDWYARNASEWDSVEDLEATLGRDRA